MVHTKRLTYNTLQGLHLGKEIALQENHAQITTNWVTSATDKINEAGKINDNARRKRSVTQI